MIQFVVYVSTRGSVKSVYRVRIDLKCLLYYPCIGGYVFNKWCSLFMAYVQEDLIACINSLTTFPYQLHCNLYIFKCINYVVGWKVQWLVALPFASFWLWLRFLSSSGFEFGFWFPLWFSGTVLSSTLVLALLSASDILIRFRLRLRLLAVASILALARSAIFETLWRRSIQQILTRMTVFFSTKLETNFTNVQFECTIPNNKKVRLFVCLSV